MWLPKRSTAVGSSNSWGTFFQVPGFHTIFWGATDRECINTVCITITITGVMGIATISRSPHKDISQTISSLKEKKKKRKRKKLLARVKIINIVQNVTNKKIHFSKPHGNKPYGFQDLKQNPDISHFYFLKFKTNKHSQYIGIAKTTQIFLFHIKR